MNPCISTYTGVEFYPLVPRGEVRLEDIAHALAHKCRFTGHTTSFWSVAQHSVLVSHACDPEYALQGLLHDAGEAYLPDVAAPIKAAVHIHDGVAFATYAEVEDDLLRHIGRTLGFTLPLHASVKRADRRLLATEQRDVMVARPWWKPSEYEPLAFRLEPCDPYVAKQRFIQRWHEIIGAKSLAAVSGGFGHGQVWPRDDGYRARCGGVETCGECRADWLRWGTYGS